jgi:imidazolonepropionase-like amidohydrolase
MEVLVAATRTASRAMGVESETGTVEKGKSADILVLDADPGRDVRAFRKLRAVVRGGVIRPIEELRSVASR